MTHGLSGRPKSPEHRAKLSAVLKGRPQGAAQRAAAPGNLARWYSSDEGKAFRAAHLAKLRETWLRSPRNRELLQSYNLSPDGIKRSTANYRKTGLYSALGPFLRERDGDLCQLCLEPIDFSIPARSRMSRSVDHVLPVEGGGTDDLENLWLAHMSCNQRKGARWAGREDGTTDIRRNQ